MVEKSRLHRTHRPGGVPLLIIHYNLLLLQLICSIATLVIWSSDIRNARDTGHTPNSDSIFSVSISSLSLLMAIVWMIPQVTEWRFWFVDAMLAVGWLIVFGIWGKNYVPRTCQDQDCEKLKITVWLSLAAWLMWIITTVIGFILFNRDRNNTHAGSWMSTIRGRRARTGYPHSDIWVGAGYPHSDV